MQEKERGLVRRVIRALWGVLNWTRRIVVNVAVFVFVLFLISLLFADRSPKVEQGAALVLAPRGALVEQLTGTPGERAFRELTNRAEPESLVQDQIRALRQAASDDRIGALVLRLGGFGGGGLTKLQALRAAIDEFKLSGKTVIATADDYGQSQYYLASAADEIWLHRFGSVRILGYGSYRNYYKDAIDKLDLDFNVFRVGEYKSAVEPYLRNDMSDESRHARLAWMSDLWNAYKRDVAAARGLSPADIDSYIDGFPTLMEEHEGDPASIALATGLVDHVASRDEIRDRLIELVGEDKEEKSYKRISVDSYLEALGPEELGSGDAVGVVIARGTIEDGSRPPGTIGGDSTARQIREMRRDDKVKAIVLRVDSGGGSAFASEVIRREVELAREEGKPVVASMGSVAASGGYWISVSADEIWAQPTTITGSIGIFSLFPTYQRTLAKLGIHTDGVGTTSSAGSLRLDRAISPEMARVMQLGTDRGYRDFLARVAEGRGMTVEEVDAVARGRVWSGEDAHGLGLIDQLGEIEEAIASAARLAGLGEEYAIRYPEQETDFKDQLLADLLARADHWFGKATEEALARVPSHDLLGHPLFDALAEDMRAVEQFNDPKGLYAYCFCSIE